MSKTFKVFGNKVSINWKTIYVFVKRDMLR